jgi:hypothetical protein
MSSNDEPAIYFYDSLPLETVPGLLPGGKYTISMCVTCNPWDLVHFEYEHGVLEHRLHHTFDWSTVRTNLLFDLDGQVYEQCILQFQALVGWFRANPGVHWISFSGTRVSVKAEEGVVILGKGELIPYTRNEPWVGHGMDLDRLNLAFTADCVQGGFSALQGATLPSSPPLEESDAVPTHTFMQPKRDAFLEDVLRKNGVVFRTWAKAGAVAMGEDAPVLCNTGGVGCGVISMHHERRVPVDEWVNEYVELDCRYPQFMFHVNRMNNDNNVKFIVIDHNLDDWAVRTVGAPVDPLFHRSQFAALSEMIVQGKIIKPVLVCTDYCNIGSNLYRIGAQTSPTLPDLLSQMVFISAVMFNSEKPELLEIPDCHDVTEEEAHVACVDQHVACEVSVGEQAGVQAPVHVEEQANEHVEEQANEHVEEQVNEHVEEQANEHVDEQADEPTEAQAEGHSEEPTDVHAGELTEEPNEEPTEAQAEEPTEAQTEEPIGVQDEEPIQAQAEEPTEAQVEEPTEAQVEEPTEAQVEEPTEAQVEEPTEAQVEEPTEAQVEEPAEAQAEKPILAQDEEPIEVQAEMAEEPTEVQAQADEHAEKPDDNLADEQDDELAEEDCQ